ncbi:MAG: DUF4406 domain-containing protein [Lachnospiraceae bacterium]|nr:DUF4406 domain-containing protein [Lachnospiraceae bacterium]
MGVEYTNPEGYADTVPYQAISNIEKEQKRYRPIVYICSAFSGDVAGNTDKARAYSRFAVDQGVIPIAPHLLLPQYMKEETERDLAMFMDIAILSKCKELWVFGNPTAGMQTEIAYAKRKQMTIKYFDLDMKEET